MQLHADRKLLLDLAKTVRPAATSGGVMSVLQGMRLELVDGRLAAICTNLDTTIEARVDVDSAAPFSAIPPAARLVALLGSMEGDAVDFTFADNELTVACGRITATLGCYKEDDWPRLSPPAGDASHLTVDDVRLIERIAFAASSDTARPALACLRLGDGQVFGTDSYRIARAEMSTAVPSLAIPPAAVVALSKTLDGDAPVILTASANQVRFESGDVAVTSSLVVSEPPKVDQFLKLKPKNRIEVDADHLLDAIVRARVVDDGKVHQIVLQLVPLLGEQVLRVTNRNIDIGETVEELPADGDFTEPLCFSSEYLEQAINAHDGDDRLVLKIDEVLKPVVIDGERIRSVLMPVKIGWKA